MRNHRRITELNPVRFTEQQQYARRESGQEKKQ